MNLLILTGIFPPDVGGPATYVPRIAGYLHSEGWDVEVITTGIRRAERNFPYPVHRMPRSSPGRYARTIPKIIERSDWADVLYVNGLEQDHYVSGYFHDSPSVQKCVGDRSWERYRNNHRGSLEIEEFQQKYPGLLSWLERGLFRTVNGASDEYVVPSHFLKSILTDWGLSEEKITVIYNHSHPPETIPEERVAWPADGMKLLTVGRLVPWKRVHQIIELFPELSEAGLIALGDGPEFDRCSQAREQSGVDDRVELKGNVPRPVVWQHLRDADVLVLNSTYEGFPHILLEAVETGTPVVAADSGGSAELAEFFPNRIHLYERESPHQLIDRVHSLDTTGFEPPEFPEPLRWNTIARQTRNLLKGTLEQAS